MYFFYYSSSGTAAIFHPSAYVGEGQSRREREHTLRGRRLAHAVRQVAPGQDHRTLPRRQIAGGQERVEPHQRGTIRQLHVYSRFVVGHDRGYDVHQSTK